MLILFPTLSMNDDGYVIRTTSGGGVTQFYRYHFRRVGVLINNNYRLHLVLLSLLLYSTSPSWSLLSQRRQQRRRIRNPSTTQNRLFRVFHPSNTGTFLQRLSPFPAALFSNNYMENDVDIQQQQQQQQPYICNSNRRSDVDSLKYLRWNTKSNNDNNRMELQTRVTTFQRYITTGSTVSATNTNDESTTTASSHPQKLVLQTIQLHGQFHFADSEEYYRYYTSDPTFIDTVDTVFYELLVDESLLLYEISDTDTSTIKPQHGVQRRKLKPSTTLQASISDETVARKYNWYCQVNCMDYSNKNHIANHWYHADFTRQEFLSQLQHQPSSSTKSNQDQKNYYYNKDTDRKPLWQHARDNENPKKYDSIVSDATTALFVGPPLIVQQQQLQESTGFCSLSLSSTRRRIFTNLFLPGDTVAVWLRHILWITIPSPELSILLIDWSSSWESITNTRSTQSKGMTSSSGTNKSQISPIALPLIQALSRGQISNVRRLVFGQVSLTGHQQAIVAATGPTNRNINNGGESSLLILKRNDHALQQVSAEFERRYIDSYHVQRSNCTLALLYGCNHCPDLHLKLTQAGFHPSESEWRTVWTVGTVLSAICISTKSEVHDNRNGTDGISFLVLFLLPLYFGIGGYDWMETLVDTTRALEKNDGVGSALTIVFFYIARHVILYLSLSKFVIDVDTSNSNVM